MSVFSAPRGATDGDNLPRPQKVLAWLQRRYLLVLLATVVGIALFFEWDSPPSPPLESIEGWGQKFWLMVLGLVAFCLVAYWLLFAVARVSETFHAIIHNEPGAPVRLAQLLVFLTIATWIGAYITLNVIDYAALRDIEAESTQTTSQQTAGPRDCEVDETVAGGAGDGTGAAAGDAERPALSADESPVTISFGPLRDVRRVQVSLQPTGDGEAVPNLTAEDFTVTALETDHDVLPDGVVTHTVQMAGNQALVNICVDLHDLSRVTSGTYEAKLIYTGDDAQIADVPLQVGVQARYLWAFVPAVWVLAVLAMWLVFDQWPAGLRRQVASFIAVAAPVAVVLSVQGFENPGWGGGLIAIATLVGAMYAAGVSAAELVKHGGHDRVVTGGSGLVFVSSDKDVSGGLKASLQYGAKDPVPFEVKVKGGSGQATLPGGFATGQYELRILRADGTEADVPNEVTIDTLVTHVGRSEGTKSGARFEVELADHVAVTATLKADDPSIFGLQTANAQPVTTPADPGQSADEPDQAAQRPASRPPSG